MKALAGNLGALRVKLQALGSKLEVPGGKLEDQLIPKEFGFTLFQSHEWQESNSVFFLKIKNTCQMFSIK